MTSWGIAASVSTADTTSIVRVISSCWLKAGMTTDSAGAEATAAP
jgi:hypothetical protein